MVITCQHLSKRFKRPVKEPGIIGSFKSFLFPKFNLVNAVQDFSFSVERGEMIGLLGPNGAGKTTLMKMFTGIIAPSSGTISVLGFEPFKREIEFRQRIALVMGQKSQLWWDLPAMDSFLLLQAYYNIDEYNFKSRLDELSTLLDVTKLLTTHVRRLSLGERMKMEMIACLLHQPEVLFLDEPTIGLDVLAQRNIRDFLISYQKAHNTTIILTSHYMADVAELCDRVVLVLDGKEHYDGSIANFENLLGKDKFVSIDFRAPQNQTDQFWGSFAPKWSEDSLRLELRIPEQRFQEVASQILSKFPVSDFSSDKLPIERVMQTILSNPKLLKTGS